MPPRTDPPEKPPVPGQAKDAPPNGADGSTRALQQDSNGISPEEQQKVRQQDSLRKSQTSQAQLPEIKFSDGSPEDVQRLFSNLVNRLDKDQDTFVSEAEIDLALKGGMFKGEDAQLLFMLKEQVHKLEKLSNDETGSENDGVTANDIAKFEQVQKQYKEADWSGTFSEAANFSGLQTNDDGILTREELRKQLDTVDSLRFNDPSYKRDYVQFLNSALENFDQIQQSAADGTAGITKADFSAYAKKLMEGEDINQVKEIGKAVNESMARSRTILQTGDTNLYSNKEHPQDNIKPEAVRQGSIGDCYFMAAAASVAQATPDAIEKMIADNKNGTFTVTFPGAPNEPITVTAPSADELSKYAQFSPDGTWPAVLEKAYGVYCQNHISERSIFSPFPSSVPQANADTYSLFSAGLRILTGKGIDTDDIWATSKDTIHNKLTKAFEEKRPVTANIISELGSLVSLSDNLTDDAGISGGHEYSIIGYDPQTKTITIRDPRGSLGREPMKSSANGMLIPQDGSLDGTFTMTIDQFCKNFSSISYVE